MKGDDGATIDHGKRCGFNRASIRVPQFGFLTADPETSLDVLRPIRPVRDKVNVDVSVLAMDPWQFGVQASSVFEIFRDVASGQHIGERPAPHNLPFTVGMNGAADAV